MEKNTIRQLIYQILIWGFGWILILIILNKEAELDASFWQQSILVVLATSIVVFVNIKWLLPYLFFPKKRVLYLLSAVALVIIVVSVGHSDLLPWNEKEEQEYELTKKEDSLRSDKHIDDQNNYRWLLRNLTPLIISLFGSSLVATSKYAHDKEKIAIQMEKNKLETEVKFLKSQINPHFLFNTLHNIYTLTIIKPERASEQLLKLSDLLRYMLYDSNQERVPLEREVEYLKNYLGLAKLKDSRGMDISFTINESIKSIKVAPLLFIPFVENAFKHSQNEKLEKGYIYISLNIIGEKITFEVDNSKPQNEYNKDEVGGIGLKNIQQRLKLLYPNKYNLDINETNDSFKIKLELDCT